MAARKRKPWNADKVLLPSLQDPTYVHVPPKPMEITPGTFRGHSTPGPELPTYHVAEVLPDGTHELWMAGDHPWAGTPVSAATEAARLQRETGQRFVAVPAPTEE